MSFIDYLDTPIGKLRIQASENGINSVVFVENTIDIMPNETTENCKHQLQEYFAGCRKKFDLNLELIGTDFQRSVWYQLQTICFGETVSYQYVANKIKNPKGVRAVGLANGKNPVSIIVPCHRVIGKNKTLTGYAGGLDRKAWLLNHEGAEFFL